MDAYIGEIRIFAGNFAPVDWAFCDGRLLPIQQYTALFSLLGTMYGGDGRTNFALPDLRGRAPMHQGAGSNLTPRRVGESGGAPTATLTQAAMPAHNHLPQGVAATGAQTTPTGGVWAQAPGKGVPPRVVTPPMYVNTAPTVSMNPQILGPVGSDQPHNNVQPSLGLNFIICLNGIYPPRD